MCQNRRNYSCPGIANPAPKNICPQNDSNKWKLLQIISWTRNRVLGFQKEKKKAAFFKAIKTFQCSKGQESLHPVSRRQIDQCDYTHWTRSHVCTHKYSLLCSLYSGVCSSPAAWLRLISCLHRGRVLHYCTLPKRLPASRRCWWTELKETLCRCWASCTTQVEQNRVEQKEASSLCFLNENLTREKTTHWSQTWTQSNKQEQQEQQEPNKKNLYVK